MKKTILIIFFIGLGLNGASAHPRFAARMGFKCLDCHVNPTGGQIRNEQGRSYGREDIVWDKLKDYNDIKGFSTDLTKNIAIGADFKTIYNYTADSTKSNQFTQTQANLYTDFRLNKKVDLVADIGLKRFEAYALLNILPAQGYVKAGKFQPAYGVRTFDHAPIADVGVEAGLYPGIFGFNFGVFNGNAVSPDDQGSDNNSAKAFVGRAEVRYDFSKVKGFIGGSALANDLAASKQRNFDVFAAVSIADAVVFWVDANQTQQRIDSTNALVIGRQLDAEFYLTVFKGFEPKVTWSYSDANTATLGNSQQTIGVGFEAFPLAGVEIQPLYKFHVNEVDAAGKSKNGSGEFTIRFHFYI